MYRISVCDDNSAELEKICGISPPQSQTLLTML